MPTLLEVIRDISEAITSRPTPDTGDCGCPAETVYPHPVPPGEPPTPFIGDDITPATITGNDICRSAYATHLLYKEWMYGLAELADIGGLSLSGVSGVIGIGGGVGAGTVWFRLTTAVLGFAFAAALAVWTALGWGSGALLRQWVDSINEDAFVCAWLDNYSSTTTPTPAVVADILSAIHATIDQQGQLPPMARWLLKALMWDTKVLTLATHKGLDETGQEISWDLSHISGTCSCDVGNDEMWIDLLGHSPNVIGADCASPRLSAWSRTGDWPEPIPDSQKMANATSCSDNSSLSTNLADNSGILLPFSDSSPPAQEFEITTQGDYKITWLAKANGNSTSTGVQWKLWQWNGSAWVSLGNSPTHTAGQSNEHWQDILENLAIGTYRLGFWRSSSSFAAFMVHAVLGPT